MSTAIPTIETNPIVNCIKQNGVVFSIALYLIVILFYMTKDSEKLFTQKYLYATMIIIPIVFAVKYAMQDTIISNTNSTQDYIKFALGIFAFILIIYFYNNITFTPNMTYLATGVINLIFALMILVALAIVYKVGYNYLYKMNGLSGFIVNFIFYIPCMLLHLFEFLNNDLKQAPKIVYLLLIVEMVLFLLYLYIPKISQSISKSLSLKDGNQILAEPLRIDNKSSLSSYVDLQNKKDSTNIVNNKFAISVWVYIVPIEPSKYPYNGDATIFEFSDFHPRLIYNGATGKFKAYYNQSKYEEFTMPLQKWNHVVFNYTKSNVDLFVNGELESTYGVRDIDNENLTIGDIISVGQDNGLSGGVCNMVYFNHPLLKYEINTMYNLNKDKDPPI